MKYDIPGLLGKLAGLPDAMVGGLLGATPVNPNLGLDPQSLQQARQQAITDMSMGLIAGGKRPMALMGARQYAQEGFRGRVFDMLKEQELLRMNKQRETGEQYINSLPEEIRTAAQVAGPQAVAQAQIQAALQPQEPGWRMLSPEEEASIPGLDPALMYKTNGKDIEVLGGRPPAPTIGELNLGNGVKEDWRPKYMAELSKEVPALKSKAAAAQKNVTRFDGLIAQAQKAGLTGSFAPGVIGASNFLRSIGIDLAPEAVKDARALQAETNANILGWMSALGGARGFAQNETEILKDAFSKLADDPAARVQILTTLRNHAALDYEDAVTGINQVGQSLQDLEAGGYGIPTMPSLPESPSAPKYQDGQTASRIVNGKKETLVYRTGRGWVKE